MQSSLKVNQTWNLSKILHCQIFMLKILHRQFLLILTVLVRKNTKMSKNGEIYTTGKNLTLLPAVTTLTNFTSASSCALHVHRNTFMIA